MAQLLAITYPDHFLAEEAAEEFDRSSEGLGMDRAAAAVVICEPEGSPRLGTRRRPPGSPPWSEFWQALLDAGMAEHRVGGVEPEFRDWLRGVASSGRSMLLVVVSPQQRSGVVDVLSALGGTSISSPLADDMPQRLNIEGLRFAT